MRTAFLNGTREVRKTSETQDSENSGKLNMKHRISIRETDHAHWATVIKMTAQAPGFSKVLGTKMSPRPE